MRITNNLSTKTTKKVTSMEHHLRKAVRSLIITHGWDI